MSESTPGVHAGWRRALRWLRVSVVRFYGGEVRLEGNPDEEGISLLGRDCVSVVQADRQYWVPYVSIQDVTGTYARQPHPQSPLTLQSVVSGWADPEWEPGSGDDEAVAWHTFVTRQGRVFRGVVRHVNADFVELLTLDALSVRLLWSAIGAAVELLE